MDRWTFDVFAVLGLDHAPVPIAESSDSHSQLHLEFLVPTTECGGAPLYWCHLIQLLRRGAGKGRKLDTPLTRKAAMRLLIAEDDKALGLFLSRGLEADGHRVRVVYDGGAAVEVFRQEMPDLTILDLNMPVKDGEQVLKELRAVDSDLPVLVLTARQEVDTRVRCLDLGADDMMLKPFSLHELRARCRALLRRKREARLQLRAGDLELDRLDHSARRGTESIVLTNKEFSLLEHLMLNRGQCVSRVELLDAVWNMEPAQTTNIVDVYVNYLRRKLKDPPPGQLIRTVRGQGYLVPLDPSVPIDASTVLAAPVVLLPVPLQPQALGPASEMH
jgi:DNA-binding response OmpR family regulator